MTTENLLREALDERAWDGPPPVPDVADLVARLDARDRRIVVERVVVAAAGLAAAIAVGVTAAQGAQGGPMEVDTVTTPTEEHASTSTTTAAPTTTTSVDPGPRRTRVTEVVVQPPTTVAAPEPTASPATDPPATPPPTDPPATNPPPTEPPATAPPTTAPPDPTTTTTAAQGVQKPFSAEYTYGTCNSDPPFDIYYGFANAGATITVASPHGGGTTTVHEDGTWEITVEFPDSPVGVEFDVTVSTAQGSTTFTFMRTT